MGANLDLSKAFLTRQHGDLLAVYTWVDDERALILIPAYRKGAAWYILKDSAAYKYDNDDYLARQCRTAAEVLGMEPSPNNWFKLASIIIEGIPDLLEMPSAPEREMMRAAIGEMQLRADGALMAQEEIRLTKDEGVAYGH